MALRKDVKHPFPPESDEVTVAKTDEHRSRLLHPSVAADKPAEARLLPCSLKQSRSRSEAARQRR